MRTLKMLALGMALCHISLATPPLTPDQFADCIGNPYTTWDTDCVLQSGDHPVSSTLVIRRSNIRVDGAWPWPMLRRVPGFAGDLMRSDPAYGPSWVTIKNIYFHGNRWNGATSYSFELNLSGCSYCQVTSAALFIGSPYMALGMDPTKPQAVSYVNFQGIAYLAIHSGNGPQCPYPAYWYPNVCLNIAGSYFYDSGVNAIGFDPKNALISSNTFTGNHSTCAYNAPGGQIDLDDWADNVTVQYNTFENGPICPNGWWAAGVELHGTNLTLRDNKIRYNAGEGIYMEGAQTVSITSTNPSVYLIAYNNRKTSGGFPGCGGFPGIRVHSSSGAVRPTENITIQNLWSISGHSFGVEVSTCGTVGPPVNYITILNNCVAGNLQGGVYAPAAGYPQNINYNYTSGCGGY